MASPVRTAVLALTLLGIAHVHADAAERPTIVGMPKVRAHLATIRRAARPGVIEAETLGRLPRTSLIVGASGSGKSLVLGDLRADLGARMAVIDGASFSTKKLKKVLEAAEAGEVSVLGIDNVDDLPEGAQKQLAAVIEGVDRRPEHLSIVATATTESGLQARLRGKFQKRLTIPALAREDREALLGVLARRTPLAREVALADVAKLAAGRTGRDLRDVMMLAREHALDDADPADVRALEAIEPGDPVPADLAARVVVKREHILRALDERPADVLNGLKVTTPKIGFADVGGLESQKQWLRRYIINPARHPERYVNSKRLLRGVLLWGEPGNGKSLIAEAIAGEMDAQLVHLDSTSVYEKWLGESSRNLERIVEGAIAAAEPGKHIVLFMDEADGMARTRGNGSDGASAEEGRVMTQLLQMINGANSKFKNVTLVMATNRPDAIDPALRRSGRTDGVLKIGAPKGPVAIEKVFAARLKHTKVADDVNRAILARSVEGASGADIDQLVTLAEILSDEEGTPEVHQRHFDAARSEQQRGDRGDDE